MRYLLLKPAAKYQTSAAHFKQAGLDTVGLALIDTPANTRVVNNLAEQLSNLATASLLIVVSTTAAKLLVSQVKALPRHIRACAVGRSSAAILEAADIPVSIPQQANSEGLLAMPELQQVSSKQVLLLKGQGGRKTLAEVLTQRGAKVTEVNLYQRQRLTTPLASEPWHPTQIRSIIATSGELIEAAFSCLDNQWLISLPWVLVSRRTAQIATKLGVKQVSISQDATDTALIQHLQQISE